MIVDSIINSFVKHNRNLVSASSPDQWQPAANGVFEDIAKVKSILQNLTEQLDSAELSRVASMLLTVMAEAGQYRHEQFSPRSAKDQKRREIIDEELLPLMGELRREAASVMKDFLSAAPFASLVEDIRNEIFPLIDSVDPRIDPARFMPFRIIQVANIVDRLHSFRLRTNDPVLRGNDEDAGLLQHIYDRKYLRFGTSGFRGRWGVDFTEIRAKHVLQAICDYLSAENVPDHVGAEDLKGKKIVIGYDSRRNADEVAKWVSQVALANGFEVEMATRDTPTPALVYHLTDFLDPESVAGLINCTASHNPPEWQGIKFNPRLGYPAPTNITDFIAFRTNEIQLLDQGARTTSSRNSNAQSRVREFDPMSSYCDWLFEGGENNSRIPINSARIKDFFDNKLIVIDEMYGAGRGYLPHVLGNIGIKFKVIHGNKNPEFPGLDYANPEEPFINELKSAVQEFDAHIGLGLDADADRFGIVDKGGIYFRPNQILPMLVKYLGLDRKFTGRVIATQTGSPLIEVLAGKIPNNNSFRPKKGTVPLYVEHPFYKQIVGNKEDRIQSNTFLVPVGIKYIEEIRRLDAEYRPQDVLPDNWRDMILIGGEESSGLTTRGHVTDKDGIWADLLVLDMLAYYGSQKKKNVNTIGDIWKQTTTHEGAWASWGGNENRGSFSGRIDIDAVLEVKEQLIDYFLDNFKGQTSFFSGLEVVFLGGIKYDVAEVQFKDSSGDHRHYLRVRSSGTEPINRIYVESSKKEVAHKLLNETLQVLQKITSETLKDSHSPWRLVDILTQTNPSQVPNGLVVKVIKQNDWSVAEVKDRLKRTLPHLENRTRKLANEWLNNL